MRTLILIVAGLLIALGVVLRMPARLRRQGAIGFTVLWLLAVLWNLRTGLAHGYTLEEEAPIQALIFLVPVVLAWVLALKLPRRGVWP
ncbi:hypothetical protein [Pseudoxanthomonas sp. UC19_8]|uniref:hypothetical protein n=1 Tax=Pseudoxanthomonas sp. UC19_8 TaxID=3350175 RepID=UPI0036D2E9C3